jgi:hypothetical protein
VVARKTELPVELSMYSTQIHSVAIPLRNDQYVDRCMVGDSKPHAIHHSLLDMRCLPMAFADDYELRSMQRDLCKHRRHRLPAHGMPMHTHRTLRCAERLLDTRYRLFVRLPHLSLSLDHGLGYSARLQVLNVGHVIGMQHVAVTSLNETSAPENRPPGQCAGGVQRDQRCGVSGGSRFPYQQQRLLKACQEFECRAAQTGADLTGIVFPTYSDDDKMWIVLGHHRGDDVAGSSESGVTSGVHTEIRLEIGQYRAQRTISAVLVEITGGDPRTCKQMPITPRADEKEIGTPLPCQLPRAHHCAVGSSGQIGRNEDSLQDRHDAHRPASDTL